MTLIGVTLTAPLELYVIASLVLGIAVSTPVIAYEIYKFVDPALNPEEKQAVYPFVASFTGLFFLGVIFGYKVLAPIVIYGTLLFFAPLGAQPVISIGDFYDVIFVTTLASGFSFTLPVFFVLLVRFGVFSTRVVTQNRRYIYAALYIVVAIMTPDGGIVGDLLLFLPMVALMEGAVIVARRYEKKEDAEDASK